MENLKSSPLKLLSHCKWVAAFSFFFFLFSSLFAQKTSKIEILHSNSLEYDETTGKKAKKLIGDVQLKHEDALMFCDSAYIFSQSNTMEAYGHVKILQGDSLQLFGDSLKYNGDTKLIFLRGNIKLIHNNTELTTRFLDYNRAQDIAYYYGGGVMVNQQQKDTLTSVKGYYYSQLESFFFKEDVVLRNPEYTITSDTLQFNSTTETVYFLGPTEIRNDNNLIYTENGWHNTQNDQSKFFENSYIYSDGKIIEGDTLYYERDSGYGEITCNGTITDTVENIIVGGDLIHLFEKKDSVMVTHEALLIQLFKDDTLYMHADTFKVVTQLIEKKLPLKDSIVGNNLEKNKVDSIRILLAYNHVKFFKKDMQGKADSMAYNFSDSTLNFYTDPVIWSDENQLTADFTYLLMSKGKIHSIYMENNAFIISKVDSLLDNFNQIKGKNIVGSFEKQKLKKIDVIQNAETIYYALDEDEKYIGVNKADGENMLIFIEDNAIKTLTFINDPAGTFFPLKEPSPKDLILKGFNWRIEDRPEDRFDIYSY